MGAGRKKQDIKMKRKKAQARKKAKLKEKINQSKASKR
jgi:hypothetical protein